MTKPARHIILQLTNEGVRYNPSGLIPWEKTNFPPKPNFAFKSFYDIFWRVEMLTFDRSTGQLSVKPVQYSVNDPAPFSAQQPKHPIRQLHFEAINWEELKKDLSFYAPQDFDHLIIKKIIDTKTKKKQLEEGFSQLQVDFRFPLKKLRFKLGYVELDKKIKGLPEPVSIQLFNDTLLPEFEHIKPYFAKVFGKKTISVKGKLTLHEDGAIDAHCFSKEIAEINEKMLSTIRQLKIKEVIKKPPVIPLDKSLFTNEDFFEGLNEEELGNTLRTNEKDLLKDILELKGIRNKRQLEYLSGKLQAEDEPIRFTLNPNFGFLFFAKGEKMYHFIWELLDSHATYVWSIDQNRYGKKKLFEKIDELINFIRNHGRIEYLHNRDRDEFVFSKVIHDNSQVVDGFPKWRVRINEKIV